MTTNMLQRDPSCMDDFDPSSLLTDDAMRLIQAQVAPTSGFECVGLRSALGRVLYEDVRSNLDVPGHTNSAMDGYAIRGSDIPADGTGTFELLGTAWAGRPYPMEVSAGQCVRIMTGAPLPTGADTVVIQERVQVEGERVRIGADNKSGQNVRHAGEDIAKDQTVLEAGRRLMPADLGLLASLGIGEVKVYRKLRVAFFSTGDELCSIGEDLKPGCVYDSNRYTLHGMLERLGAETVDMGVIRDRRPDTFQAFEEAAKCADVIITSGGVSVGEADYVKECLDELGQITFWKVAMKPGRPLAFGRIDDAWFFGLPGNPVSVMVTFYIFVQPALRRLMGESNAEPLYIEARCESKLRKKAGRTEFQRGILRRDDENRFTVTKTGAQGSGILTSMSQANCFIILPLEAESVDPGTVVEVLPFVSVM
jgi:molybdopterin molybdotransferase